MSTNITKKDLEELYKLIPFKNLDSAELTIEQQTQRREATQRYNNLCKEYEQQEAKKINKPTINIL